MAFIDSFFNLNSTVSVNVQTRAQTITSGELGPVTWTTSKTLNSLFWKGSMAESIVSEKLRVDISAVFLFRPSDCTTSDFPKESRIDAGAKGLYDIIYVDDVANQGKVFVVAVKEVVA
jgi:hypothetical protein